MLSCKALVMSLEVYLNSYSNNYISIIIFRSLFYLALITDTEDFLEDLQTNRANSAATSSGFSNSSPVFSPCSYQAAAAILNGPPGQVKTLI